MTRVIIIHGWEGNPQQNWLPLLKKELEKSGYEVSVPAMPDTNFPKQIPWLQKLISEVGAPDENLYLVGHSLGCITIMRFLETLTDNQKIGGIVFVAGFTEDLNIPEIKNFFETPIDFNKIKQKAKKFVALHSDDDVYVDLKYGDIFKEKLGAEVIIKHDMDHFSDSKDDQQVTSILLEILQSIIGARD